MDHICHIINGEGMSLLFNKIFTEVEQNQFLADENQLFKGLRKSIQLNELKCAEIQVDPHNKIFFKHYANDYIISEDKNFYILEVNDSPIIQKDTIEFVTQMINIIIRDARYHKKYLKYKRKYLALKHI